MLLSLIVLFAVVANALPQSVSQQQEQSVPKRRHSTFRVRTNLPIQARANRLIPVVVGGAQDTFVPNLVRAAVGDVIQFQFSNGNHTVTQSAEGSPCQPLQATDAKAIHSGHIPYVAGQSTVGTFNMPVTSTDPMFLYCATGPHCLEGQVMVINPTSEEQLVNYSKLSTAATENIDGTVVTGGAVGEIPLEAAAFVPAAEEQGPPSGPPGDTPSADGTTSTTALVGETTTTASPAKTTAAAA